MKGKKFLTAVLAATLLIVVQPTWASEITFTDEAEETPVFTDFEPEVSGEVETATVAVSPKKYAADMDSKIDWGQYSVDYMDSGVGQILFVRNVGQKSLHVKSVSKLKYFDLKKTLKTGTKISPAKYVEITVFPQKGLGWGTYEEKLVISMKEGVKVQCLFRIKIGPSSSKNYDVKHSPESGHTFIFTKDSFADEWPEIRITLGNQGRKNVSVKCGSLKHFKVSYDEKIKPGGNGYIRVSPKESEGVWSEKLTISISGGKELKYKISQKTPHVPLAKEIVKTEPANLNFGEAVVCYSEVPAAQKVKVTNITKETIHLQQTEQGRCFIKGDFSKKTLKPGESASFTVQPKRGIPSSRWTPYKEKIQFQIKDYHGYQVVSFDVEAQFKVMPYCIKEVEQPTSITGLSNGTAKTASELRLPGYVHIQFWDAVVYDMDTQPVEWDLESCSYDPECREEQNFTVNGTVKLPKKIKNYNNVDLRVSVNVQVKAYEEPVSVK